jgi:putative colanic acid biosysnthesis UDP-glucose lipid carrier transferase
MLPNTPQKIDSPTALVRPDEVSSPVRFAQGNNSFVGTLKRLTDPLLIQLCLFFVWIFHGEEVSRPLLILAILTFSLTYPGTTPFRYRQIGLFGEIVSSWGLIVAVLGFLGWAVKADQFFNVQAILSWAILTPFMVYLLHLLSPYIAPRVFRYQTVASVVVVGVNETGLRIAHAMNSDALSGAKVTAFFDDRAMNRLPDLEGVPFAGKLDDLADYVQKNRIATVYICLPMASQPRIVKLLNAVRDTTASIYFAPDIFMFDLIQARMDTVAGIPVLAICESPFHGTTGMVKRWFDLLICFFVIVILSPVFLAVAIGVKLSSPGPIFYRQKRYGLDGREISVWKFRSMQLHDDAVFVQQAIKGDPRITRIGAFLRRTSLDELPQLFNVLQGSMSLVGPRPHAVSHNELYRSVISGYMIRHKVRPGITGLAQVSGARGETDTLEKMQKRIDFDMHYLRNWSVKLDLAILLKTVKVVFKDPNAY